MRYISANLGKTVSIYDNESVARENQRFFQGHAVRAKRRSSPSAGSEDRTIVAKRQASKIPCIRLFLDCWLEGITGANFYSLEV